jgi:ABC-type Fe3+/spermidine/putrescine transport system ATPase subunit
VGAVSVYLESRLRDFMLSAAFDVGDEMLALVGRPGSGKSVVLRSIAGVFVPDSGSIEINGRTVFSSGLGINVPATDRHVGYVPQTHALFPHLSVADNIAFALRREAAAGRVDVRERVSLLLDLLNLQPIARRLPDAISDHDQQRVALARALVIDPDVLLLDDPYVHLDFGTRRQLRQELVALRKQLLIPTIFATGELEEALEIADRAALIDQGRVLQVDQPSRLLTRPANRRVADIVSAVNVFHGEVIQHGDTSVEVRTMLGVLAVADSSGVRGPVDVVIRPEQITVLPTARDRRGETNVLTGQIVSTTLDGAVHALVFVPDAAPRGTQLHIVIDDLAAQQLDIASGQQRAIQLPQDAIHLMSRLPDL